MDLWSLVWRLWIRVSGFFEDCRVHEQLKEFGVGVSGETQTAKTLKPSRK